MSKSERSNKADTTVLKTAITSMAGASIEWYDFFVYGTAAALVFPTLFFSKDLPPFVAQIAAFSTFAVGFIARPIGGVIFGHFGDKVGRKTSLVAALMMMGCATTLIGFLPTYAQIGAIAPLCLVILRFLQGLAVGGQWGGAVLLATESAPEGRRGFYGSFAQIGVPAGVVLANLVFLLLNAALSDQAFQAWGWRIPFILSFALVALGMYVQLGLEETPVFKAIDLPTPAPETAKQRGSQKALTADGSARAVLPIFQVLASHPREILLAAGAFIAINGNFYILITYIISYGVKTLGLPQSVMLKAVLLGSLAMAPCLLAAAAFSDKVGRRPVYMAGALLLGLWSLVFFPIAHLATPFALTLDVAVGLGFLGIMYGPQAAFFAELFPPEVRYTGASLGYSLGTIVGGGLAPIVATWLLARFNSTLPIGLYMAGMCLISMLCVFLLSEKRKAHDRP